MFNRTPTLGAVRYRGQRKLVVAALTGPRSAIPRRFNLQQVVAAIDPVEYDKTLKHGKMVVTIRESVRYHLKELVKLGQLEQFCPGGGEKEVTLAEQPSSTPAIVEPTELLKEWARWEPSHLPFVLGDDRERLEPAARSESVVTFASWSDAISDPDLGSPEDKRLHLGLLPQPFIGDLQRASIYVLLLNPGLEPSDYYGEYEVPGYRKAVLATLKQCFEGMARPFIFLDPQYSWHGGFRWWHRKLRKVIEAFADESKQSFAWARDRLAAELASIELLPYHSAKFCDAEGWLGKLRSVSLARAFVRQFVIDRVKRGEAIAVVLRKVLLWDLPDIPGVVQYEGKHAQGARLDPGSDGGGAILAQLQKGHQ